MSKPSLIFRDNLLIIVAQVSLLGLWWTGDLAWSWWQVLFPLWIWIIVGLLFVYGAQLLDLLIQKGSSDGQGPEA